MARHKSRKAQLAETLKRVLGQRATVELLKQCDPKMLADMSVGKQFPTVAELLVNKVVRLALDPNKSHQWAVELIFDRVEGKPVRGEMVRSEDRGIEDKLDAVTTEHLNRLAAQFAEDAKAELVGSDKTPDGPDRPAKNILDLPGNRPGGAKGVSAKPSLAALSAGHGD